jgi:hypothetical protein
MTTDDLNAFVSGYVDAALFSEPIGDEFAQAWADLYDEQPPSPGDTSLQSLGFEADSLAPEALNTCIADCEAFATDNAEPLSDYEPYEAGSLFLFTRNGHGCGFWESSDATGYELTDASKPYGEVNFLADAETQLVHVYPEG